MPHAFGRSLSLHILKSCWLWSWESHDWLVSPKAKVKFGALWSEGRILPSAVVCRMLPMVWEGMDTLRILLSLFECSLFLSVRFMIIKSIFLQPDFQIPLGVEIHTLLPFFTNSYTNLGPSLFLWWLFITEMYPRVRSSSLCFRNQFYLIPSVLPEHWIEISGARLHAMSHIGVLAAPQASPSPNKICQADKKLISLSCIPSPGTTPALGVEGMQSWARSLCLHRSEMNLQCEMWLCICFTYLQLFCIPALCSGSSLGCNQPLCLQAGPKGPLISSHLCCLIPWEGTRCFLRQQSFPRQAL